MNLQPSRLLLFVAVCVLLSLSTVAAPALAGLPHPDHVLFGLATSDGRLVSSGRVSVSLNDDPDVLLYYDIGQVSAFGERYVLRLPMDVARPDFPDEPRPASTAREGDLAKIYLDGVLAAEVEVGEPGTAQRVDIDPFFNRPAELEIKSTSILEGDAGITPVLVEVALSRPLFSDVRVDFATSDDTAMAGSDYQATSDTLTIFAGDVRGFIEISIFGDTATETEEQFFVDLTSPVAIPPIPPGLAIRNGGRAVVSILPDDEQWQITVLDAETVEGDGPGNELMRFVVGVDPGAPPSDENRAPSGNVAVTWATEDGTAVAADYGGGTGQITVDTSLPCAEAGVIAAHCGVVEIAVFPDREDEPSEEFYLQLSAPTNGAAFDRSRATGYIRDNENLLLYVQSRLEGELCSDCLDGARSAVVSPEGTHLIVASELDSSLVVFGRDPIDGRPDTLVQVLTDDVGGVDGLAGVQSLVFTSDGANVYAVGFLENEVAWFTRDPATGLLAFQSTSSTPLGPVFVSLSPDELHLYVVGKTGNAIAAYDRASLTPVAGGSVVDGLDSTDGLLEPRSLAFSQDGLFAYAVSPVDATLVAFARNPADGKLSFLGLQRDSVGDPPVDGLDGAVSVALSPDGSHVYVAAELDDSVSVFERNPANGQLTFVQRKRNGLSGVTGMDGAAGVGVSPDGAFVYVAALHDDSLVVFARDAATGRLTPREVRRDGDADTNGPLDGLLGSLHIGQNDDGRHIYVSGPLDNGLAFFFLDRAAPPVPLLSSPSHAPGTWSKVPTIALEWTGADDPLGVGLEGYASALDNAAGTDPGILLDLLHDDQVDPQATSKGPLVDHRSYWFHLRACDFAGNCSGIGEIGPFRIDTVAPETPILFSSSHEPNEWSNVTRLVLGWATPVDPDPTGNSANSKVAAYELLVDASPVTGCSQIANLDKVKSASVDLTDGEWWAHLCAVDRAGNWSAVGHLGPILIDTIPPTIDLTRSVALPDSGFIVTNDTVEPPTQLLLTFDSEMAVPDDAASFELVEAGPNGALDTLGCGALRGDDLDIGLEKPSFDAGSSTTALRVAGSSALAPGYYRLLACGTPALADRAKNRLDGNGDGVGGDAYVLDFLVQEINLLVNPNFDVDLAGWTVSDLSIVIEPAEDGDGLTPFSGSAHLGAPTGIMTLSQCIALAGEDRLRLGLSTRVDSDRLDSPEVYGALEFFDAPDCGGSDTLGLPVTASLVGESMDQWVELESQVLGVPPLAVSVRVQLVMDTGASAPLTLIDSASLSFSPDVLFKDGFESGDVSVWSSVTARAARSSVPATEK